MRYTFKIVTDTGTANSDESSGGEITGLGLRFDTLGAILEHVMESGSTDILFEGLPNEVTRIVCNETAQIIVGDGA